jgi:mannose-6-phosphate isomerase-like protein (cupin superfamily)
MLRAGDRYEDPSTGAKFEVLVAPEGDERRLELRRVMRPGTGKVVAHVHLDGVERFVVESGIATVKLGRRRLVLGPGEEVEVPVGTAHVNAYNEGNADLVMRHAVEPANDFVLGYFETLGRFMREGRADRQGELPLAAAFAVGDATNAQTFAVGVPHALQRAAVLPIGARIARAKRYELALPNGEGEITAARST